MGIELGAFGIDAAHENMASANGRPMGALRFHDERYRGADGRDIQRAKQG
jgi:hypothetical protein